MSTLRYCSAPYGVRETSSPGSRTTEMSAVGEIQSPVSSGRDCASAAAATPSASVRAANVFRIRGECIRTRSMTSEHVFDPELEDPRGARLGRDLAEVAGVEIDGIGVAAAAQRRARIAPVEVIQQIERLHPELHVLRGAKRNPTRQRQIGTPVCRSFDAVACVGA